MGKYIVELTDDNGAAGSIRISLPFRKVGTNQTNSTWRVLDENFLNVRSGTCQIDPTMKDVFGNLLPPLEHQLVSGAFWGVVLFKFTDDFTFVEESGGAKVLQPWVGHCKPGNIYWSLLA